MNRLRALAPVLLLLALIGAGTAWAQFYNYEPGGLRIQHGLIVGGDTTIDGGVKVGTNGTVTPAIRHGVMTIGASDTTGTLTLTGTAATARVSATIMTGNSSNRTIITAAPATNAVNVTLSGTAGAETKIGVIVFDAPPD